jgi:hypothetical protein
MTRRRTLPRTIARAVLSDMHESVLPMIYSGGVRAAERFEP